MSFLAELKRRNVIRMAGLYLVGAWLIVQVTGTLLPMFDAPPWVARTIVVLLAIGFVPALVFAWLFELTPQGLRLETAGGDSRGDPVSHRRIDRLMIGALVLALAYFAVDKFVLSRRGETPVAVSQAPAAAASGVLAVGAHGASGGVEAKSIAVLPFADLSPAHDQEYFSDGMAEELLNALAKVRDLKVSARTASFHYKGRSDTLKTIGEELGVANVLEGSVRKQGDKVRITAQLVRTADGFHRWSESYDGELNDVFELQERIARAITEQLQAILSGDQQQRLVRAGTASAEAYALYLQANAIYNRRDENMQPAIDALEAALRLDPKFARAQARLAAAHVVWTASTRSDDYVETAEAAARKAIALDDTLAEPWAVLGRGYGERRRFLEARAAYDEALRREPDDALTNYWYGVSLIMTGYTREGRARLDRSLDLDPMQPNAQLWKGLELSYAGDQDGALKAVQRAVDMGLSFAVYGVAEVALARGERGRAFDLIANRWRVGTQKCGMADDEFSATLRAAFGLDPSQRPRAVAAIDRCLAMPIQPVPFGPVKALMLLGEPERVLRATQDRLTNNETFLFELLWSPTGEATRRSPGFAEFARTTGLAAVWDKYGAPDRCTRRAPGEYACDSPGESSR